MNTWANKTTDRALAAFLGLRREDIWAKTLSQPCRVPVELQIHMGLLVILWVNGGNYPKPAYLTDDYKSWVQYKHKALSLSQIKNQNIYWNSIWRRGIILIAKITTSILSLNVVCYSHQENGCRQGYDGLCLPWEQSPQLEGMPTSSLMREFLLSRGHGANFYKCTCTLLSPHAVLPALKTNGTSLSWENCNQPLSLT